MASPQPSAIGGGELLRGLAVVFAAVAVLAVLLLLTLNAAGFFACGCTSPAPGWSATLPS